MSKSLFELASKDFTVKYFSHSVPIMYLVIFYCVTLIFLAPFAFIDSNIRIFFLIYISISAFFVGHRFIKHKEDFVSEKVGLEYAKLSLGAKGSEQITEGEIIEATRPVFEENIAKQIKSSTKKPKDNFLGKKLVLEARKK